MAFKPGDLVTVVALKQTGEITAIQRDGTLAVLVGSLKLRCKESELLPAPKDLKKKKAGDLEPFLPPKPVKLRSTVDLHGMKVADALAAVDSALNRAAMDGVREVEFIHGIGHGKVRDALLSHLKTVPVVAEVRAGAPNPGVTLVYLRQ